MILRYAAALSLCSLTFLVGCSDKAATGNVSGIVTYKGSPVTGGTVVFHTADAGAYSAPIGADGKYSVASVPSGNVVVTVDTESLNPKLKKQTYVGQTSGPGAGGAMQRMMGGGAPASSGPKGPPQGSSPIPEGAKTEVGTYVKIPREYADKTKSSLKITVADGDQEINLELKD